MNHLAKLSLIALVGVGFQAAYAQANFNLEAAYYTLDSTGPVNFLYFPDSANMSVDFLTNAPAFKVGDSTDFGSGVGTIIYTVTTDTPIIGIDMTMQGDVEQWGEIHWTETALEGTHDLGIINGSILGSMYSGGTDGAFTVNDHLTFDHAVTSFKVKKSFDLDIAANTPPSSSIASLSLVEQHLVPVPEPTTIAGLALGAAALLGKRRKKS